MSKITLEILETERDNLIKKLEVIEHMIKEYSVDKKKPFTYILDRTGKYKMVFESIQDYKKPLDGFPVQEKWLNQILYLLENRNRFMSNHEIAYALTQYHYGFNVDKMKRKVSVVISAAYKANRIEGLIKIGTTKSAKDALWGFDRWLTDNKKIKEKHSPLGRSYFKDIILG
jgi:predicted AlkP superfamily pyrophosphatase or phosphodiesterase